MIKGIYICVEIKRKGREKIREGEGERKEQEGNEGKRCEQRERMNQVSTFYTSTQN